MCRLLLSLCALLFAMPVVAAPRDELLQAVPDDFTFCIVVQNLRDHTQRNPSASLQRLLESPVLANLKSTVEGQRAVQSVKELLAELDVTPEQIRDDLLGDAIVVAYRKGPADRPEQEDGLILVHARDAKLLPKLLNRINEIQTKAGELSKVEEVDGKEGRYTRRVKSGNAGTEAYAIDGNQLLFATREASLQSALARRKAKAENVAHKRFTALNLNDALAVALVNPRSFDAELQALADGGAGNEALFLREFGKYWKALDGVAVYAKTTPTLEVGIALDARPNDLPPAAKVFFAEASKLSPLWASFPEQPLFAAVGRVHLEAFFTLISQFVAPEERQKIRTTIADAARAFWEGDDATGLVKGFGPDVGFFIAPPSAGSTTWFPQMLFALKTAPTDDGKTAEASALAALDFLYRSACLSDKELRQHKETIDGLPVKSLSHASKFPPGFRPAFAAKNGYIVLANAPATIQRFNPVTTPARSTAEVPLVRVSASAWRTYLATHRDEVAKYLGTLNNKDAKAVATELENLITLFTGFDHVELLLSTGPQHARLFLRLTGSNK